MTDEQKPIDSAGNPGDTGPDDQAAESSVETPVENAVVSPSEGAIGPGEEGSTPVSETNPPEPIKEMKAKTIREIRAETVPPQAMPPGPTKDIRTAETPEQTDTRREVEDALNKPIEAIEDAVNTLDRVTTPQSPADVLPHPVGNTTNVFGKFTIPLNIYDVVFISLAVFTLIEVVLGTALQNRVLAVIILMSIAFVKGFHVVWFYMHLGQDSRIFWATLLAPFFIALMSLIFLTAVPPTGYSY